MMMMMMANARAAFPSYFHIAQFDMERLICPFLSIISGSFGNPDCFF
jgi:hypothetical protein